MYVGWTTNPEKRWRKHRKNAVLGMNFYLYRAMRLDPEVFEFKVIAMYSSESEAMSAEKYWIAFFKSNDDRFGYNMTEGGEGCVIRGSSAPMYGRKGPLSPSFGKHQSEAHRQALRESNIAFHLPDLEKRLQDVQDERDTGFSWGVIGRLAMKWNVSHTQVRRFINKHTS